MSFDDSGLYTAFQPGADKDASFSEYAIDLDTGFFRDGMPEFLKQSNMGLEGIERELGVQLHEHVFNDRLDQEMAAKIG